MEDLIKRSDAIAALLPDSPMADPLWRSTANRIMEIPSADRPQGEWVLERLDNYKLYKVTCSCCGWWGCENYDSYVDISDFAYCPNCGADMRGADDD